MSIGRYFLRRLCPRLTSSKVSIIGGEASVIGGEVSITSVFLRRLHLCLIGGKVVFLADYSVGYSYSYSSSCSSLVLIFGSDFGLVSAHKYSFMVIDLKSIGLLGS
jgi:hypothetical protein